MTVRAVFFDFGETLVDESYGWGFWADRLGLPRFTMFALIGAAIARGEHPRAALALLRPELDFARARAAEPDEGEAWNDPRALYPDARRCLEALGEASYRVGVVGNQPDWVEPFIRRLELPVDVVATSGGWGVSKPDPAFFARVVEASGCAAGEVAYVGDRVDNDVLPARAAGLVAVLLRRGPWGYLHARRPDAARAHLRIDSLDELLPALRDYETRLERSPQ